MIEEAKRECRPRPLKSCRKPLNAKKLEAAGNGIVGFSTAAVPDTDSCDTRNVEQLKFENAGWQCTRFALAVTELIGDAEIKQRRRDEELPCPFLKCWLEGSREEVTGYLDAM